MSESPAMIIDEAFLAAFAAQLEQRGMILLGAGAIDQGDQQAYSRFTRWLAKGHHGAMGYLENHLPIRKEPRLLLDEANIALVVGLPYYHSANTLPLSSADQSSNASSQTARYSVLPDYHKQIPKKVKAALSAVAQAVVAQAATAEENPQGWHYRVVTDSAPILERAVAERHSRGFIGKNTMFIHPQKGSFILLGEVIAKGELRLTEPTGREVIASERTSAGGCGSCARCQTYCPTDALTTAYTLDARHCLSYWSIEHRGTVPYRYWRHFADYLFGCDICQTTCPYNRASKKARQLHDSFALRELPSAEELVMMRQKDYERQFGGIAMTRAKRAGLRRNGLLALSAASDRGPKAQQLIARSLRRLSESLSAKTSENESDTMLRRSAMSAAYFAALST